MVEKGSNSILRPKEERGFSTLEQANQAQTKLSQKVIRVFFSSPFGGLELEREELTKKYWPQLQSLCSRHGYTFVPVDLRWGITSDLSASASTINICLSEIDRSDIFVGFFGQRYGWHGNDELLQKTFDVAQVKYPWLADHRGKAVTELEFLHGHLRNPGAKPACFYFRDKAYDDKMFYHYKAEGNEREMRKFCSSTDGPQAGKLLEDLKQRVYATHSKAAQMMFTAVNAQIKKMLATSSEVSLSSREIEKAKHNAYFVRQYAIGGVYIGGNKYLEQIDELTSSSCSENPDSGKLAIVGNAGSGKTALLCNWIDRHSNRNPQDIVVYYFIGCDTDTTDPKQVLSWISDELKYEFEKKVDQTTMEISKNMPTNEEKDDKCVNQVVNKQKLASKTTFPTNLERQSSSGFSGFFSCFRGNKVDDSHSNEINKKPKPLEDVEKPKSEEVRPCRNSQKQQELRRNNKETLKKKFSPKDLLPTGGGNQSIQKLLANITEYLRKISDMKRKAFIIIDALNKTDDLGKTGKALFWLPNDLPPNVHLIVSTRTEDKASFTVLTEELLFAAVDISLLDDFARETIAKNMLAVRGKEFSGNQMVKVASTEQTRNPLYLKIFLEEMCNFGDFFQVDKQIDHLLDAKSTKNLFLKFIKRMETDYNPKTTDGEQIDYSNVVKEILCLIEVSHEGLSEDELRSILYLDSHAWSAIFFAMASFLLDRAGLYSFAYEDLSKAVNEYYLQKESDRRMFVQKLSKYFQESFQRLSLSVDDKLPSRISSELPRILAQLNDAEQLASYLSKLCVMANVPSNSSMWFNMMEYWTATKYSSEQISQAFCTSIDDDIALLKARDLEKFGEEKNVVVTHEKLLPVVLRIATFMVDAGFGKAAIPILVKAKYLYDSIKDTSDLEFVELYCKINYQLACLYVDLDMLDEAEPLHKETLNTRESFSDQFLHGGIEVATCLHGLGVLEQKRKNYKKVDEYNGKILAIYEKDLPANHEYFANLYNNWGISVMLSNLSHDPDAYNKAIEYFDKAQQIYESVYFGHVPPQVTVTLNNLALCYRRQEKYEEARKVYKRILNIRIATLGENHVDVGMVYRNLGTLDFAENNLDLALGYYKKSLDIYQAFGGEDHVETALSLENLALVNIHLKQWDDAHYYFNKAGEILHRTQKMDHSLARLNHSMAEYYLTNGREQDAYKLFERLVGSSIATPRDYAALEYFDRQLPNNKRPTRPYEHTTDFALEKWPDNEMLLRNKITYLSETGDVEKLMVYLVKAGKCTVDIYVTAYSAFVEKKHTAIAMPLLAEGLKYHPENQLLLRNMVELSLAFKDYDKVIECSTRLLDADPTELFALMFLGRAQTLTGDLTQAKQSFIKGLTLAQEANDEENSAKFQNFLKMLEDHCQ